MRLGETPVHIPNTMVKTQAADDTMLETAWESRWMPDSYGGVAQLGEHLPCKQGVMSSNLTISTRYESTASMYLENRILKISRLSFSDSKEKEKQISRHPRCYSKSKDLSNQNKNKQLFVNKPKPRVQRYAPSMTAVPAVEVIWLS